MTAVLPQLLLLLLFVGANFVMLCCYCSAEAAAEAATAESTLESNDNQQQRQQQQQQEEACDDSSGNEVCTAAAGGSDNGPENSETATPAFDLDKIETMQLSPKWDNDDTWGFHDLWWELDCTEVTNAPDRPIPTQAEWNVLRDLYRKQELVDIGNEKGEASRSSSSILPTNDENGWQVPYLAKLSPGAGRGVFSTGSVVKRGTRVWTCLHGRGQRAQFANATVYRSYLRRIPAHLACDVLQWTYILNIGGASKKKSKPSDWRFYFEMDEGCLLNTGDDDFESDASTKSNIGCLHDESQDYEGGCQQNLFALRDIEEGEEFLVSYADWGIDWPQKWKKAGF